MRKVVCLLIVSLMLLSGCTQNREQEAEVVVKKDYSEYSGIVADTKSWYEEFKNLPIANENMTEQELRQFSPSAAKRVH